MDASAQIPKVSSETRRDALFDHVAKCFPLFFINETYAIGKHLTEAGLILLWAHSLVVGHPTELQG